MADFDDSSEDKTIPFFPDHITTEAKVAVGIFIIMGIIGIMGVFNPLGLEAPADPMNTPAHTQPEWYFLFLYQMLQYVPKTLGALLPIIALLVLILWPFFDAKEDSHRGVRWRRIISVAALAFIAIFTILGLIP
jgi:quinol-cytochrome oxidoreductase complex cytochrome b subunit